MAIQTAVLGTTPACQFHLTAKSLPCAMHSDCRIFRCNVGLLGQIAEFAVFQIHDPERIPIFWLHGRKQAGNALADLLPKLCLWFLTLCEVPPPNFHGVRRGRSVTVVINHGVAQYSIEPRHDFFVLHSSPMLQPTSKRGLQNILGGRPGLYAPFQKCQKRAMPVYQLRNCLRRQRLRRLVLSAHHARLPRSETGL